MLDLILTCRSIGSGTAATMMGQGLLTSRAFVDTTAVADSVQTMTALTMPKGTPTVGTGFDSNQSQTVDLFVACGTSNAANTWRCEQYILQSLN
jgi:hypothetical protein